MNETLVHLPDARATRAYGEALAALLRAGDLVVLSGDLGAGKTTLTQGIGAGLGIRGQVASPTFIIARVHPSTTGGPALVHVDAYRLGSFDELEALDLDTSLDESVTVVEWGEGLVEGLAEDRLEITIVRPHGVGRAAGDTANGGAEDRADEAIGGDDTPGGDARDADALDDDPLDDGSRGMRTVTVRAVGPRWAGITLPVVG